MVLRWSPDSRCRNGCNKKHDGTADPDRPPMHPECVAFMSCSDTRPAMQQPSMSIGGASIKQHYFSGCLARRMAAGCPDGPSVAERDPGELPRARRFQALETLFFWQAADASIIKGATDDSEQGLSPHPFWKGSITDFIRTVPEVSCTCADGWRSLCGGGRRGRPDDVQEEADIACPEDPGRKGGSPSPGHI